jgi:hypothetical protein
VHVVRTYNFTSTCLPRNLPSLVFESSNHSRVHQFL